uniref:hypothetical protein n=1 Tax=Amycolatopsis sp. CA-151526 TaxID=3239921 RepID=UPI003F4976CA
MTVATEPGWAFHAIVTRQQDAINEARAAGPRTETGRRGDPPAPQPDHEHGGERR